MSKKPSSKGPLDGLKVLDLSRILAGPTATQLLGDMGADIVKVERPGTGDDTRTWGPPFVEDAEGKPTSESGYYLSANRNKRSLAVDITAPEGVGLLQRLASRADVLVENFKLGDLARRGLGYKDVSKVNPGIVYCSITGFGQTGPNAAKAGYDIIVQGYAGLMSITGAAGGEPQKVGVAIADLMTGMYAATAILAALNHRGKTGEGQHIDLALVDSLTATLINQGTNYLLSGEVPRTIGNAHPNIVPYQAFATADSHIIIAVGNDGQFRAFAEVLGRGELADDERYATNDARVGNREELVPVLAGIISGWSRDELLAECFARGVPAGPVHSIDEVFATEQAAARDMMVSMDYPVSGKGKVDLIGNPIRFSKTPVSYRHAPPSCDEHADEVVRDWLGEDG